VLNKFPSKSQRKKNAAKKRSMNKTQQAQIKNEESSASLKPLSGQPRQLPSCLRDSSSKRSRKTLPVGIILKNTFPELLTQSQFDAEWEQSKKPLAKKEDRIQNKVPVSNLFIGGEKNLGKGLDFT